MINKKKHLPNETDKRKRGQVFKQVNKSSGLFQVAVGLSRLPLEK